MGSSPAAFDPYRNLSWTGMAQWLAEFHPHPAPRHRVDPELTVEIVEHAVSTAHGPRSGTSYTTRGLDQLGQPELVLTWCGPRMLGTPAAAAIAALRSIGRAAAGGLELRPGSSFYLGEGALLEGVGLTGLVFVPAQAMPGLLPPAGALHAVAVTSAELEAIRRTTAHRVLARLGDQLGKYPWPAWSCPRRSVARPGEETGIDTLPRRSVRGLTVSLDRTALSLRMPSASGPVLADAIASPESTYGIGVLAVAEPDACADGHLLWDPVARETRAIGSPRARGHRTAGAFIRVSTDDRVLGHVLEDGFDLRLDPANREALCSALHAGEPWQVATDGGDVRVEFQAA